MPAFVHSEARDVDVDVAREVGNFSVRPSADGVMRTTGAPEFHRLQFTSRFAIRGVEPQGPGPGLGSNPMRRGHFARR